MKNSPKLNNVSRITEKKEAVKIMSVKKVDISIDNVKPKNSQNFKKIINHNKKLKIFESIIAKLVFAVVIIAFILVVKNIFLSTTKPSSNSGNDNQPTSMLMNRSFKRKLVSCSAGYFLNGRTCKKCSAGTYSTYGRNTCLTCASGTYSKEGASSCTKCPAGTFSNAKSSSCSKCNPGTYSDKGASTCKKCLAGTYSYAGATVCNKCAAGTYSNGGTSICNSCLAGTYSIAGSSKCTQCPAGKYSLKGYSSCLTCNAGYYSKKGSSNCFKCPAGTYSSKGSGSCTKCIAGTYSTIGSSVCSKCSAGYYSKIGSSSCIKCPKGTKSKIGSSTCTALCSSGYYYNYGNCKICPENTFSLPDFSRCLPCQNGYSSAKGSTSCQIYSYVTAEIGAKFLNMRSDINGIYHADFDCWQQYFGYRDIYDKVAGIFTRIISNNEGKFTYNGKTYILWGWKGDYLNLGAGAELAIYYYSNQKRRWDVDKRLAMPMTLTLKHKKRGTIVNNWDSLGRDSWWITAFNPRYKNVNAEDLKASFSVKFKDSDMFKAFSTTSKKGWKFDYIKEIAYLVL